MTELQVERRGRVERITIRRPATRNALTRDVVLRITASLETAGADADVRVVLLTGAGGHFCAGADLRRSFEDDPDFLDHLETYMGEYHALIRAIVRCPKPVIAQVDGAAVGFGADMALASDLRVVSTTAYLEERFVKIGLLPDGGGTFWLPRLVGTARAMEMILLAERLDAARMRELGIVSSVVAPEDLDAAGEAMAERLAAGPPLALAAVKRAVYAGLGDLDAALDREFEEQIKLLRTKDAMEGVMAFLQKRAPMFVGA